MPRRSDDFNHNSGPGTAQPRRSSSTSINVFPLLSILGRDGAPKDVEPLRAALLDALVAINQDYREASRFIPPGEPTAEFHAAGTGPFAGYDIRLKRTYIRSI